MAYYQDRRHALPAQCEYLHQECSGICCLLQGPVMLITEQAGADYCRSAVNREFCPIYECAEPDMVTGMSQ